MRLVGGAIRSAGGGEQAAAFLILPISLLDYVERQLVAITFPANSPRERSIRGGDGTPAERLARFLGPSSQCMFRAESKAPSHFFYLAASRGRASPLERAIRVDAATASREGLSSPSLYRTTRER